MQELRSAANEESDYLDWRSLNKAELTVLAEGLEASLSELLGKGPASFASPEFYEGYVEHVKQLLTILRDNGQCVDGALDGLLPE